MNQTRGGAPDLSAREAGALNMEMAHGIQLIDLLSSNIEGYERQSVKRLLELLEERYAIIANGVERLHDEPILANAARDLMDLRTKIDGVKLAGQRQGQD